MMTLNNTFMEVHFLSHTIHHFKVHTLKVCSLFTMLCNHHHYLIPEHFKKETPYLLAISPNFSFSSSPLTTLLLSVFIDLPVLATCNTSMWPFVSTFFHLQYIQIYHIIVIIQIYVSWQQDHLLRGVIDMWNN